MEKVVINDTTAITLAIFKMAKHDNYTNSEWLEVKDLAGFENFFFYTFDGRRMLVQIEEKEFDGMVRVGVANWN